MTTAVRAGLAATAIPQWLVDAVMGLVTSAYEAGRAAAMPAPPAATQPHESDVLTRVEAAAFLRVSRTTLDRLVRSGELDSFMAGTRRMFRKDRLRAYTAAGGSETDPAPLPSLGVGAERQPVDPSG